MKNSSFKLNRFSGKMKILHLSWMAFFLTFLVWFNHAPLLGAIAQSLSLSASEIKALLILNVAIAIPARVIIGMVTDHFGPRLTYSLLLLVCSIPCFYFSLAENFEQAAIARFLLGFIGAGFVIGIRLVSEWFPANELGIAEGIYGGWGNFGSAAAAISLPALALTFGGDDGWRYAISITGLLCVIFSIIFYVEVRDTPKGSTYFKPKSSGAMEVTSRGDFLLLLLMKIPMYLVLGLLVWKLSSSPMVLLSAKSAEWIYIGLILVYCYEVIQCFKVNKSIFVKPIESIHRYQFKQVAILNILYFATFGSELAVVSMLPLFFAETFELDMVYAGLIASGYAFMNLFSRPGGGWISDRFGRKASLLVLTSGLAVGYFMMAMISSQWPLFIALLVAMSCSFFVQAGEGAVFAAVPLIKRRLTGQIAGMTGAYGNVGAVCFLTVLSFTSYQLFFLIIALCAMLSLIALIFLTEPKGSIAEINEDGSIELIGIG
ncbi:NarK family nitrate/nitrite MFS transporter [Aliikangiella sp. G2MR2-5]|uniref:NarK family nitrate/nitrite MFS transporter n=1 Tax=Aliikangiella sp. G2MR2-5 TaxID=2788943 RepID=UPI0018AA4767|nr:NarK family nitrate/nitrite MFS transporter [Aliikangiella sp. G2MR2-5]